MIFPSVLFATVINGAFITWAERRIEDQRVRTLFQRMASRSGIERRWTVLPARCMW